MSIRSSLRQLHHLDRAASCIGIALTWILLSTSVASSNQFLLETLAADPPEKIRFYTEEEVAAIEPSWPNPYLSFLPVEAEPDFDYWRARMKFDGAARQALAVTGGSRTAAGE